MSINQEQLQGEWRADLARIAAQIDNLKTRIDNESRLLYASLSAEVAALQSDLEELEAAVDTAGADTHARQIAAQIEELSAKGDAAYKLLQAEVAGQLNPTDAEIRQLEAIAASASGSARARITARIEALQAARTIAQADTQADDWAVRSGDTPHSP